MSEYNDLFDFNAPQFGFDAADSEYPAPPSGSGQSGASTAPLQPSVDLMGGDTAAQLLTYVDFAPSEAAESHRLDVSSSHSASPPRHGPIKPLPEHACAACLALYQTDSALHKHAIEAQHQAYKCKCGTGFNKYSALKRHIDTKDAPKTFACTLCNDKFTRKDKVNDHCRHYHKVTEEGLRFLLNSQEVKPRAAALRRRRAPVPLAAASSGTPAPAISPAHAPAGPSVWSYRASTGKQFAGLPAGPFVPTGSLASTSPFVPPGLSVSAGSFVPSAGPLVAAPVLGEDIPGTFDNIFWDETWATGLDSFPF